MEINALSKEIIGATLQVHRALGPGLLESAYEACTILQHGIRRVVPGPSRVGSFVIFARFAVKLFGMM